MITHAYDGEPIAWIWFCQRVNNGATKSPFSSNNSGCDSLVTTPHHTSGATSSHSTMMVKIGAVNFPFSSNLSSFKLELSFLHHNEGLDVSVHLLASEDGHHTTGSRVFLICIPSLQPSQLDQLSGHTGSSFVLQVSLHDLISVDGHHATYSNVFLICSPFVHRSQLDQLSGQTVPSVVERVLDSSCTFGGVCKMSPEITPIAMKIKRMINFGCIES